VAFGFLKDFAHISWAERVGCLVGPGLVVVYLHDYAWAYADERGLTFRRYVRKFCVPWEQVDRVDWNSSVPTLLVVHLETPVMSSRTVKFTIDMTVKNLGAAMKGQWTPEIVIWIMNQMRPAA
jgi:hypothetical protein